MSMLGDRNKIQKTNCGLQNNSEVDKWSHLLPPDYKWTNMFAESSVSRITLGTDSIWTS